MKKRIAFTLAEILITIMIIGIVATITIPAISAVINERINSSRHANIVYKITQATNLMKSNGELTQFNSTDDFVDVLQKYLKIAKRCDSNHIADCWPTRYATDSNGEKVDISTITTGNKLGLFKRGDNNNVGLVLVDGASIILSYDQNNKGLSQMDKLTASATTLPAGIGKREVVEFTTNSTSGIAMIMDVNGAKGPNSETIGTKYHDIRSFNGATLSGCGGGIKVDNRCYVDLGVSYDNLDCSRVGLNNGDRIGNNPLIHPEYNNYCGRIFASSSEPLAGASKACEDLGMELPEYNELVSICQNHKADLGITGSYYFSARIINSCTSQVRFDTCAYYGCSYNGGNGGRALCIKDI